MQTTTTLREVPGNYGWPWLGHTVPFIRDAEGWARRNLAAHGPVFKSKVLFEPGVIFADPDAAKYILMDRADNFSSQVGWRAPIGKLFRNGLMLRDFDDHRFHRKIMQEAFRQQALRDDVEMMNPIIERGIAGWDSVEDFSFYREIKQLTLDIAAEVFMGEPLGGRGAEINDALMQAVTASISPVRKEWPFSQFRRGMAARRLMQEYFGRQIPARRAGGGRDLFTRLCHAETEDGDRFSDDDIVDHMIFLMLAAHDTTTSTLATMAWELARDQTWQERLRDEVRSLAAEVMSFDDRDHLEQTEWVFREALRMHPPVPFMPRGVVRDDELLGYPLPAGSGVSVCSLLIHRLPEWWDDPERFDPERFGPGRMEHKRHSHSFIPFGGGAHTCIGMHFAGLMAKAIVVQLLRRYRFRTHPGQTETILAVPIPKPKHGLPLKVELIG